MWEVYLTRWVSCKAKFPLKDRMKEDGRANAEKLKAES
jgi:hypothetical protein